MSLYYWWIALMQRMTGVFHFEGRSVKKKEDFLSAEEECVFISLFGGDTYLALPGISHRVRAIMDYKPPAEINQDRK